jgi:hypothetical protein
MQFLVDYTGILLNLEMRCLLQSYQIGMQDAIQAMRQMTIDPRLAPPQT